MFLFLKAIGVMKLLCALVSLTPDQEICPTHSNIHYMRSLIGNSSWSANHDYHVMFIEIGVE